MKIEVGQFVRTDKVGIKKIHEIEVIINEH